MAENRVSREQVTRTAYERPQQWMPPETLPSPTPEPGYAFRWIRISMMGEGDARNISSRLREGWEPVKASEHPEVHVMGSAQNTRFPDCIEVGGLMLCKTPIEFVEQRDAYYRNQADSQMSSVDNSFMRESDARMPLFKERRSEVKFGRG